MVETNSEKERVAILKGVVDCKDKIIATLLKENKKLIKDVADFKKELDSLCEELNKHREKEVRYEKNHCFDPKEVSEKIKEFGFETVHKSLVPFPGKEKVPISVYEEHRSRCGEVFATHGISWRWKYVNCPECLRIGSRSLGGKPKKGETNENS